MIFFNHKDLLKLNIKINIKLIYYYWNILKFTFNA